MAKILRAIPVNAGVQAYYRKRLIKELKAMHKSVSYWVLTHYRMNEAEITGVVQDASPVKDILKAFRHSMNAWLKRWDWLASWLAPRVVGKVNGTTTRSMAEAFKAAGMTVKFDESRSMNTTVEALIAENVNLIKHRMVRPYLAEVEEIILRGVTQGSDLGHIASELHKRYEITERRAKMIARDQLDKANQAIQRTRDLSLGITEGIWVHMPGQYTSRKTHIAMHGKRFKLDGPPNERGLYDSAVKHNVLPASEPMCRCVYRAVLPDFGE